MMIDGPQFRRERIHRDRDRAIWKIIRRETVRKFGGWWIECSHAEARGGWERSSTLLLLLADPASPAWMPRQVGNEAALRWSRGMVDPLPKNTVHSTNSS